MDNSGFDAAKKLLTPVQLASLLGLVPETVRRAARSGAIPSVRYGSARRFTPEQVQMIIKNGWSHHAQKEQC